MSTDLSASQISAALEECCTWSVPVTLLFGEDQIPAAGCFDSLSMGSLRVALHALGKPGDPPREIRPGQRCVVTFSYRNRPHFFAVPVIDGSEEPSKPALMMIDLHLPREIPASEVRQALRVPVLSPGLVDAHLRVAGLAHRAVVKNLSLSGALLEFDEVDSPGPVKETTSVELTLKMGELTVQPKTVVKRHSVDMVRANSEAPWERKHRYGVMFPESSRAGPSKPPTRLAQMVENLMARWIKAGVTLNPGA